MFVVEMIVDRTFEHKRTVDEMSVSGMTVDEM
jgi:hypothetical protein